MRSCNEVSSGIASGAIERASWPERLACWLHLLFCRHCRRYRDQLDAIGEAARREAALPDGSTIERLESAILDGDDA